MTCNPLLSRSFLPIFFTQFFGAFNDNAFKLAMLTLISYYLTSGQNQSEAYQALASALFIAPFFFISANAGLVADNTNKARLAQYIKFFEIILMCFGSCGLYFGQISVLMLTLAGLGLHSAFFGPIKYSILPDLLPRSSLLLATGLVEASTFLAILFGTTLGALSIFGRAHGTWLASIVILIVSILGFISSLFIPSTKAPLKMQSIGFNLFRNTYEIIKVSFIDKHLRRAIFLLSWFWLVGSVYLIKLPDFTHYVLYADSSVFAFFLGLFSIGIGFGSILVSAISKKITLRYVFMSMLGLSFFALDLGYASSVLQTHGYSLNQLTPFTQFIEYAGNWRIAGDLFMLAFFAGLFIVPLYTMLQIKSKKTQRARTIAANNIMNALFMVMGSLFVMVLLYFKISIPAVFMIMGVLNAAVAFFGMAIKAYCTINNT